MFLLRLPGPTVQLRIVLRQEGTRLHHRRVAVVGDMDDFADSGMHGLFVMKSGTVTLSEIGKSF